nr:DegV family protein [Nosocomiicoccus massiliensis]
MKIAYIIDSTADLDQAYENHPDIYRVSLHVTYENGDVVEDSKDETEIQEFYRRLKKKRRHRSRLNRHHKHLLTS